MSLFGSPISRIHPWWRFRSAGCGGVVCASEQYLRRYGVPQVPNDIRFMSSKVRIFVDECIGKLRRVGFDRAPLFGAAANARG